MMCLSVLSDKCDGVEPLMSKSLPANGGFADGSWQACSHTAFYNPSWRAGMGLDGGRKSIFRIWMSFAKNGLASSLSVSCH